MSHPECVRCGDACDDGHVVLDERHVCLDCREPDERGPTRVAWPGSPRPVRPRSDRRFERLTPSQQQAALTSYRRHRRWQR